MEAKDTVMSDESIAEVWHFTIEFPDRYMALSMKDYYRRKAILNAQAEISFKAGYEQKCFETYELGFSDGKNVMI